MLRQSLRLHQARWQAERHYVLNLSIHPWVHLLLNFEHSTVVKTNEPILMPIGTSVLLGKGMKSSTLG